MPLRGLLQKRLQQVCDDLVLMGGLVRQAIQQAHAALTEGNVDLAQQVIDGDEAINELRYAIEESCFTLLATQQPAARDLRTVVTVLNSITDLERMGDYAKGIGQIVVRVQGRDLVMSPPRTPRLATLVCDMLDTALEAFVHDDVAAAQRVCDMDDQADHLYRETFESAIQAMIRDDYGVRTGMHLVFAAHNLERIGDRITNVAERVIFMVTGVMEERNW